MYWPAIPVKGNIYHHHHHHCNLDTRQRHATVVVASFRPWLGNIRVGVVDGRGWLFLIIDIIILVVIIVIIIIVIIIVIMIIKIISDKLSPLYFRGKDVTGWIKNSRPFDDNDDHQDPASVFLMVMIIIVMTMTMMMDDGSGVSCWRRIS